jgi:TATA-binding protein-associated factor
VLDVVESCVLQKCFPSVRYARLDGSVDPTTRGRLAQEFNSQKDFDGSAGAGAGAGAGDSGPRVLLLTARACGLGLNLTAADTVIFLEHDWNPYVDLQAMDRAHRLGQTKQVTVYRLLAEATIEARIMCTQELKTKVVDEVITAANAGGADAPALGAALWSSLGMAVNPDNTTNTTSIGAASAGAGGWSSEEYESLDLDSFLAEIGIEPE